jgi:hypothetical protein
VLGKLLCFFNESDVSMSKKNISETFMHWRWVQFVLGAVFLLYFISKIFN